MQKADRTQEYSAADFKPLYKSQSAELMYILAWLMSTVCIISSRPLMSPRHNTIVRFLLVFLFAVWFFYDLSLSALVTTPCVGGVIDLYYVPNK